MPITAGEYTITDLNDPIISGTSPLNPKPGQLWLNTSVTPNELLSFENGVWKTVRSQPKPGSVGEAEIQAGAVTSTKIKDDAITSTKITGGAITTPKLATNAVTADKIAAGTITAEKISAGVITADKLSVLAKNLVNNYSVTKDTIGWSPKPALSNATDLNSTPYHFMSNSGDVMVQSDLFDIDPTVSYRASITMRAPHTAGTRFFGFYCYDKDGARLQVIPISTSTLEERAADNNPYFWSKQGIQGSWLTLESYIMGCNTTKYDLPKGKNCVLAFRMPPNAAKIRLRYLNYYNSTTNTHAYWWGPSVVPIEAGELQADRIRTGMLRSFNNASWIDMQNGQFSLGNNDLSWNGSSLVINGEVKSISGDRTAHIRNGQYMIFKGTGEVFNISNFIGDGSNVHQVLGPNAKGLLFGRTTTVGMVTRTYGGIQISPEKFYLTMPAEFKNVNVTDTSGSYKVGGANVLQRISGETRVGNASALYTKIEGLKNGGFSAANDNYLTLGRSDFRWMSLWVVSGVVQTSGKKDKQKIHKLEKKYGPSWKRPPVEKGTNLPEYCSEEDINEVLDAIADNLCTFKYNNQEGDVAWQLGVIADDIDHFPGYQFIGTKTVIPYRAPQEGKPEVPEIRDPSTGEVIQAFEPAIDPIPEQLEQTVHGLNPLPVAMLAIAGYRKLRSRLDELEDRLARIENLPSIKSKLS